jgi:antitoxin MazE
MKSSIRSIGNSKGIIIPQRFLKDCSIEDDVVIEVINNQIVISASGYSKRTNWEEAFKEMAENGDDQSVIPDFLN